MLVGTVSSAVAPHSNSRTTLEIYSQARIRAKREAQQRVVEMIMPEDTKIMMQHIGRDECLGGA